MNNYALTELEKRAERAQQEIKKHDQADSCSYLLLVMLVGAIVVAALLLWGPK